MHVTDVIGAGPNVGTGPVAADIAADGEWIVVKNYSEGFLWRRAKGQSVAAGAGGVARRPVHRAGRRRGIDLLCL